MTTTMIESRAHARLTVRRKAALVVEVCRAYAYARRELRRTDLPGVVASLRRIEATRSLELSPRRLARVVSRTLCVLPVDSRCLMSSLVLTRLLARRGYPAVFVRGVSPSPTFAAHAWLECDGRPVLQPGDESFGRLLEL
jgi:hypothetical protein